MYDFFRLFNFIVFGISFSHAADIPFKKIGKEAFDSRVFFQLKNPFRCIEAYSLDKSPSNFHWVGEAEIEVSNGSKKKGLWTSGIISCIGLSGFTHENKIFLAHIHPTSFAKDTDFLVKKLDSIGCNFAKPLTLVSKYLYSSELSTIIKMLQKFGTLDLTIYTLPVFRDQMTFKEVSHYDYQHLEVLKRQFSQINYAVDRNGRIYFFHCKEGVHENKMKELLEHHYKDGGFKYSLLNQRS